MIRTSAKIAMVIVLAIVGIIGAYRVFYPVYTYRYRMTVEVEIDGKIHSGSSVIQIRLEKQPTLGQGPEVLPRKSGEGVVVDLGGGRNVIAILASGLNANFVDYPYYVVPTHFGLGHADQDLVKYSSLQGRWDLPLASMPTLVTFADLKDPTNAQIVYAIEMREWRERTVLKREARVAIDRFAELFGPSVQFKRAYVEMVPAGTWPFSAVGWPHALAGEPVTRAIEKKMPVIIHQLREEAKVMQFSRAGYAARLGHFYVGD